MANRYLLILAVLIQGCGHGRLEGRYDPNSGMEAGEGVISGKFVSPLGISRPSAFASTREALLVFRGVESNEEIRVPTQKNGVFKFKAPHGKYRLKEITSAEPGGVGTVSLAHGSEAPEFILSPGKTTEIGSLYSSCGQWNDTEATTDHFRDLILKKKYDSYARYTRDHRSCLIFVAESKR